MTKFLWLCLALMLAGSLALAAPARTVPFWSATPDGLPYLGDGASPVLTHDCDELRQEPVLDCDAGPCVVECDWGPNEGEPTPNYRDHFNGGCNDPDGTPSFRTIECEDTICGRSFTRVFIRDTDWFEWVVGPGDVGGGNARVCFIAEFRALVAVFAPGPGGGCEGMTTIAGPDTIAPCDSFCYSLALTPGTYWIYISYPSVGCPACGDYTIITDCDGIDVIPIAWDMGDIQECYPTEIMNPAHGISEVNIAWLGGAVDAEDEPQILDEDEFDDGVNYLNAPWLPCTDVSVQVQVTGGPGYAAFAAAGGTLYLNGWKDGNLDCDFCDVLCDGNAPEWIVQNQVVTPGPHSFTFPDPGVMNLGRYEGRFRWRLSERPLGSCETGGVVDVGEVEDYIIADLQLAVSMLGSLVARAGDGSVTLSWATASETQNDHFDIERDGQLVARHDGAGTSAGRHDYAWTDLGLDNGRTYQYTLYAVDANGTRELLATAEAAPGALAGVATEYTLYQNHPNPFNPTTTITFDLPADGFVTLAIFNLVGQHVATIVSRDLTAGRHTVEFDARDLPSGAYLYRLEAGSYAATKKMLLMK